MIYSLNNYGDSPKVQKVNINVISVYVTTSQIVL